MVEHHFCVNREAAAMRYFVKWNNHLMDHSFSTFAKFFEKLRFLSAYQGVRDVSFSENFANLLNEWSYGKISQRKIFFAKQQRVVCKFIISQLPSRVFYRIFDEFLKQQFYGGPV